MIIYCSTTTVYVSTYQREQFVYLPPHSDPSLHSDKLVVKPNDPPPKPPTPINPCQGGPFTGVSLLKGRGGGGGGTSQEYVGPDICYPITAHLRHCCAHKTT